MIIQSRFEAFTFQAEFSRMRLGLVEGDVPQNGEVLSAITRSEAGVRWVQMTRQTKEREHPTGGFLTKRDIARPVEGVFN